MKVNPGLEPIIDCESDISKLTREEKRAMLLEFEEKVDMLLAMKHVSQECAWDMYFGLLHECDESRFIEDRPRILSKIDTKLYNPFLSKDPGILMIARLRAVGMGLSGKN